MNRRRLSLLAGAVVLLVIALPAYWAHHPTGLGDGGPVVEAVSAFCQDRVKRGLALPATVTLGQLVAERFLSQDAVSPFGELKVEIALSADETRSQSIIARAQLPDGSWVLVCADGSSHLIHPQQRFP